jgi:hypothetical protein
LVIEIKLYYVARSEKHQITDRMFGTAIQELGAMDVEASETRSDKSLNPVGESKENCSFFEPII